MGATDNPEDGFPELTEDEVLRHYGYMKADFMQALREGAQKWRASQGTRMIDAVFSVAGRLLEHAETVFALPLTPQPAHGAARGLAKGPESASREVLGCIRKGESGMLLEVRTIDDEEGAGIEVNVYRESDGREHRPFSVHVITEEGEEIAPRVEVDATDQPPRFGAPGPGVYVFVFTWDGGRGEVRLDVKE